MRGGPRRSAAAPAPAPTAAAAYDEMMPSPEARAKEMTVPSPEARAEVKKGALRLRLALGARGRAVLGLGVYVPRRPSRS
mmetsp:Transcript_10663/g.35391  ORF Transcript_10663/g.35391 Transcript_10663/m.35391 type:complete len:80 (+) Transcript_10663:211-450(+)